MADCKSSRAPAGLCWRTLPARLRQLVMLPQLRTGVGLFWSRGWPLFLLFFAIAAAFLAYQFPIRFVNSLATLPSPVQVRGAFPLEQSPVGPQRWTGPVARIILRGVGPAPLRVQLRFFGGAAAGAGRLLQISSGDQLLLETPLRPDWQELTILVPAGTANAWSGDMTLLLTTQPLLAPGDPRALGVSLSQIRVRSLAPAGAAPTGLLLELILVTLLLFWSLRIAGIMARPAGLVAAALALLLCLLLAGNWLAPATGRLDAAIALDVLADVLPLTLVLAIALRAIHGFRPLNTPSGRALALVHCAALLIFVLRLGGVLHPQFAVIDQVLRANQLLNLADGRADVVLPQLEQQHEWGTREPVPYSVLTYYLLTPLAWLSGDLDDLVRNVQVVTVLLDASVPLLLWALLRGGPQRDRGGAWAAMVYAALPIGYLFFHDGSFPTTIGLWLVLLALVLLRQAFWLPTTAPRLLPALLALIVSALAFGAYVTHIAFLPFLGAVMVLSIYSIAPATMRPRARAFGIAGAVALIAGWIIFYGSYTLPLIQRTIPAFLGIVASEGAVGRDAERFFDTPLNSFPEHLIAHFRVWPVLLAAVALLILLLHWRRRFISHVSLAFAALFAITAFAEQWFGLWNKHMYFAAPGVALLAGLSLAWLAARGRSGRLLAAVLLAYLFWESSAAWAGRVLLYSLPQLAL